MLPELRRIPEDARSRALEAARATALDTFELAGMAAGVVLVTALTRHGLAGTSLAANFGATIANFVVALPLLTAALAPFHLLRLRRGLRAQIDRAGRQ